MNTTIEERFWAKVDKTDTCWNWTATKHAKGYGHFKASPYTKTPVKAHRWSYEQANGPIPDGLTIDHLCRNTSCVRPDHLEAVDGRTNTPARRQPLRGQRSQGTLPARARTD